MSLAYRRHQLVEIAELGQCEVFGEDSLKDGVHAYTVMASSAVRVLWLRPEALHHLSSKGFANIMRAAWMRNRWRGKQHEILQVNRDSVSAATKDVPLLRESSAERKGNSGDAGTDSARQESKPRGSSAEKNAEAGMQTIIHLAQWADKKASSTRPKDKGSQPSPLKPRAPPGSQRKLKMRQARRSIAGRPASAPGMEPGFADVDSAPLISAIEGRGDLAVLARA